MSEPCNDLFKQFDTGVTVNPSMPLVLPVGQQDVFYRLTVDHLFPHVIGKVAELVSQKGEEFPSSGPKIAKGYSATSDVDWFSTTIVRPFCPTPCFAHEHVAPYNIVTKLILFNGTNAITFYISDTNDIIQETFSHDGSQRVIDSSNALFERIKCSPFFPAGNAAGWILRTVQSGLLDKDSS